MPFTPSGAWRSLSRRGKRLVRLSRLDVQQSAKRRLVLLVERDNVEDTEAPAVADEDLLARSYEHCVGCRADVGSVLEVQEIGVNRSSVQGPDGVAEPISEKSDGFFRRRVGH